MDKIKQSLAFLTNRGNKIKGTNISVPKVKVITTSTVAGLAQKNGDSYTIYINKELYDNAKDFIIKEILPHEVAHCLLFSKDKDDHSKEWKDLCKALGGSGDEIVKVPIQLFGKAIHYQYRVSTYPPVWLNKAHHKELQTSGKQYSITDAEPFIFIGAAQYTGKTFKGNPHE